MSRDTTEPGRQDAWLPHQHIARADELVRRVEEALSSSRNDATVMMTLARLHLELATAKMAAEGRR